MSDYSITIECDSMEELKEVMAALPEGREGRKEKLARIRNAKRDNDGEDPAPNNIIR